MWVPSPKAQLLDTARYYVVHTKGFKRQGEPSCVDHVALVQNKGEKIKKEKGQPLNTKGGGEVHQQHSVDPPAVWYRCTKRLRANGRHQFL